MNWAILWCGLITSSIDGAIFERDIDLAIRAARARGVQPDAIHALVCDELHLPEGFAGHRHRPIGHLSSASRNISPRPPRTGTHACSSQSITATQTDS